MSFGVTVAGFIPKTFDDTLKELEVSAKSLFGDGIELSVFGEVGQFIQLMAEALTNTWEDLEDVYYAVYINTAEGVSLDRVIALGGLSRRPAQKSSAGVNITGVNSTTIAIGALGVQTAQGIQFENITSGTVINGVVSVTVSSLLRGDNQNVAANTIVEFTSPFPGLDAVTNSLAPTGGGEIETDADVRARYLEIGTAGGSSVPAIIAALKNVDGVTRALVVENATNITDGDGRPPHSIECIVSGSATDSAIADAIFNSKPTGIEPLGSESKVVIDENGDSHTIKWNIPTEILINVKIEVTSNAAWVSSNIAVLKTRTVQHIGGVDTIGSVVTEYPGLGIAENVFSWGVESNFDGLSGIDDIICYIAFSPTVPSTLRKLTVAADEFARCDTANITVVVS